MVIDTEKGIQVNDMIMKILEEDKEVGAVIKGKMEEIYGVTLKILEVCYTICLE